MADQGPARLGEGSEEVPLQPGPSGSHARRAGVLAGVLTLAAAGLGAGWFASRTGGVGNDSSTTVGALSPGTVAQPSPPPSLALPPSGRQPAVPGAAQGAVRTAFLTLYSHGDQSTRFQYLQNPDAQVAAAGVDAAKNNATLASATTPAVLGVVFTDPTDATVLYEIDYQSHAVVGPKVGYAVLDNGTWKVTRATYCADLGNGGGHC
jgi:hypothetical protein